jgi:protein-S-isoprenylcysteine O-methyltransferase Ste14
MNVRGLVMGRKTALSLILLLSAGVAVPPALRHSLLQGVEVLVLHLFFFVDVAVRPAVEGVDRESLWQARWGKLLMLLLVYLPVYLGRRPPATEWVAAVGLAATVAGAALALRARLRLGKMATPILTTVEGGALCRQGIYRVIRHPIYSGFALAFLGHQVTFIFAPGLVIWLLFIGTFLRNRIAVEEEMLVEQFDEDYRGYRKATWKLFPWIY